MALAAVALLTPVLAASAAAQSANFDSPYPAPKITVGLLDADLSEADDSVNEFDSLLLLDLGLAYVHPLTRAFSLGGQVRFFGWGLSQKTPGVDEAFSIDLSLMPQLRHELRRDVELYGALLVGPSLEHIAGWSSSTIELSRSPASTLRVRFEPMTALGFHVGLLGGARYALGERFGLLGEIGATLQRVTRDFEGTVTYESDGVPAVGHLSASSTQTRYELFASAGLYF